MTPLRVVFMGTPEFSVPSLEKLSASAHQIVVVVTKPERPVGRGRGLEPTAVKVAAERLNLPVLEPESLHDEAFLTRLREMQPDLFAVVAFRILPPSLLAIPRLGSINLHASLLPRYRGAAPIQRAIMNGERETGVTVFLLESTVDTGRVLRRKAVEIGEEETAGELATRLSKVGAEELVGAVCDIASGTATGIPQDDAEATFAPKITRDDGRIRWTDTAERIRNLVRGLNPAPGAYALWRGQPFGLLRVRPEPAATNNAPPGTIIRADDKQGVLVAAGSGAVWLETVHPPGKRPMEGLVWARGARPQPGARFE